MQNLSGWITPKTAVIAVLSPKVLNLFESYTQDSTDKAEAGGIIIGYRRGPHFEINHATEPTKHDQRSRFGFKRSAETHQSVATESWKSSSGQLTYLGEWHTHPELTPSPSLIDLSEWNKLAKNHQNKKTFLVVIVGIANLWVGLIECDGNITELVTTK